MKKRCLILFMMLLCLVSAVACGNGEPEVSTESQTEMQTEAHTEFLKEETTVADNVIPLYCWYKVKQQNWPYYDKYESLLQGQPFPEAPNRGDIYTTVTFIYTYQQKIGEDEYTTGWNVVAKGNDQYTNDYSEPILESICGQPVTSMVGCFEGRRAKMDPIVIPEHITDISCMYNNCVRLTKAPDIPSTVKKMDYAFAGCKRLTGEMVIDANPDTYEGFLQGLDLETQKIELRGKSGCIEKIRATAVKAN